MAVSNRGRNAAAAEVLLQLQVPRKWKDDRETTPERTRLWTKPSSSSSSSSGNLYNNNNNNNKKQPINDVLSFRTVPVVYYLCRNGQLEHPHFMEVPLSSSQGLFLPDVINRLNILRGNGMASLYSWSSKRSYKNGFVWQDLADNDFIHPSHGNEYVLKGSELLVEAAAAATLSSSSRSLKPPPDIHKSLPSSEDSEFPAIVRRRNQSWSSVDLNEYKVYKTESVSESTRRLAADASTQTDDKRRRRRVAVKEEEGEIEELHEEKGGEPEANREEIEMISPPPSDSSPETLESLMQAGGRLTLSTGRNEQGISNNRTAVNYGRAKASTVLMQLISCGAMSFRDCGASTGSVKEQGLSLIGQHYRKGRLPRGGVKMGNSPGVKMEDKEYFSGSLIETNKKELQVPTLKRSNSYNADRSPQSQLRLVAKEIEGGGRTTCIPRKTRAMLSRKDEDNGNSTSKRFETQQEVLEDEESK